MATATITFTSASEDDTELGISVNFDPEFKNSEGASNPLCHLAAMLSLEAVTEALIETT